MRCGADFSGMKTDGRKYVGRYFLLVCAPAAGGAFRAGVICGKKYSLSSVVRNRARRLLWESCRLNRQVLKPCRMLLIARSAMKSAKQTEIGAELLHLARKAGIAVSSPENAPAPETSAGR